MAQIKKFEKTLLNEYMAWNLHDRDVEKRGREAGLREGRIDVYIDLIKSGLLSIKDAAAKLNLSESELRERL